MEEYLPGTQGESDRWKAGTTRWKGHLALNAEAWYARPHEDIADIRIRDRFPGDGAVDRLSRP